jgi:competence protein ComEC
MTDFHKGEIPLTLLLLPFIAGLSFAVVSPATVYLIYLQITFYVLLFVFVGLNIGYKQLQIFKARWAGGLLINLLLILAGIICIEAHREVNSDNHFSKSKATFLIARITNEPKLNGNNVRFSTAVEQATNHNSIRSVTGSLMVTLRIDSTSKNMFAYGDELLIPANYTLVEGPANPAEFNYRAYLAHQNIYHQSYLREKQVLILKRDQGNVLVTNALKLRRYFVAKLANTIRDTDALAVTSTIILGYRTDLRKEVQEAYSKTGTMHLLSVSGMHVGLVYLLISFALAFLPAHRYGKLIKAAISIFFIWCYALITGFSPAVCRAALMLSMVIIGFAFNRHINRLNLLAVSAFILLLYNPFLITDAVFQLSYLAVFGIIITQPLIYKWVKVKNKLANRVWMVCSVSISAQVVLFPVSAFYFHDFPVYFLASNLFIIIPSAIVMYGGIAYLLLPRIPIISESLGWLLEKTVIIMTSTLRNIEHAPMGSINKIWLNPVESVLFYGLLITAFYGIVKKSKTGLKLAFVFLMVIAISISIKRFDAMNTNSITFFSLRKNTGILFREGDKATLLSDLKPADKNYQYSIQPYLDSCKITNVEIAGIDEDIMNTMIAKRQGLVRFIDKSVLILDKKNSAWALFIDKPRLDYVYITGSPAIDLVYLKQNYNFKTLIVNTHNSPYLLNKLEEQNKLTKVNLWNLKRNNSLIIVSNNGY